MTFAMNIDTAKSYATEANLLKALEKLFGADRCRRALVVRNREGRWTAVFPASACDGALYLFAQHGFPTIG